MSAETNPARELITLGQSIWYDNISRDLLKNGEIKRLIAEWGVRGMTSNPTIFDQAISKSAIYDGEIAALRARGLNEGEIFEELAIADIGEAADLLRPVYDASEGEDGFVSIEVSPLLARNTEATVEEGRRLFKKLARPNIMIKVPGTAEGIPAVRALLAEGVNINITLLFSADNYVQVAHAYCEALRERVKQGQDVSAIRSVASFFVSRVDTTIDSELEKLAPSPEAAALKGKFGIANSKVAYHRFQEIFLGESFSDLRNAGAAVQRPLWASTGTKNPNYPDTLYVDGLIGPHTVNTVPHDTLAAFVHHGTAKSTLTQGIEEALTIEDRLTALGIKVQNHLTFLQEDGVKKFSASFTALNEAIAKKF